MRKIKSRSFKNAIVVIVDGEDEKWYVEKVKEHYPSKTLKETSIKPEFPEKKRVEDLFAFAKQKTEMEYCKVVLILDMDTILNDGQEFEKFKIYFEKYQEALNDNLSPRQKPKYGWMEKLLLIVNTPCLEFWYLLHFGKTTKYYADYEALKPALRRLPGFDAYEKREDFYKKSPDIYNRLGGLYGVLTACKNAVVFNLDDAKNKGVSEMNKFFEFFGK